MEFRVPQYVTVVRGEAPRLGVRRVVVHAGVTEISENSFWGWTNLEEVVFEPGSRLERIGDHAFAGTALREFIAPKGLRELGENAFTDCRRLGKIEIGTNCGALTVTADSTLTVRARREAAEESSESMQIEVEDADVLREQLEQSKKQIDELKKQLATLTRQREEEQRLREQNIRLQKIEKQQKIKKQMLEDPCALVIPDGVEVIGECQYSGEDYERIFIPKSVVEIRRGAFMNCKNLKEVVIEEDSRLEKMGAKCFYSAGLEEITLPRTLKEVSNDGYGTFYECRNLKVIYVEEGCEVSLWNTMMPDFTKVGPSPETVLGNTRIYNLRGLRDIVIPDGTEKVGNQWFWGTEVTNVTIPESVREIGTEAFCRCKKLKKITFAGDGQLEKIGSECFYYAGIEEIIIPKNVVVVGEAAFSRCSDLKHVTFAEGSKLERIGGNCFCGTGIEEVTLPGALKEVGHNAFGECNNLKRTYLESQHDIDLLHIGMSDSVQIIFSSVVLPGGARVQDLRQVKDVIIPDGTEKIGSWWFHGCMVENITFPVSVKDIGGYAFYGCRNLRKVTFSRNSQLERIGDECFGETKIEEIVIPRHVVALNKFAFYQCKNLKRVTFAEGSQLEKIEESCFRETSVETLVLPSSLREIGCYAFASCKSLKSVIFAPGSRLERIGYDCFGSAGIERIAIPRGVAEIQRGTFEDCKSLKEVVFEEGSRLETIGNGCFASAGLEEIVLPRTLKGIGAAAFDKCDNLKVIYVEEDCKASLCDAKVPDSAKVGPPQETMVGSVRVWDLRKLRHVTIPDGTEKVGNQWFWGTEIERVEVPVSVREICAEAFYGCKKLREVTFKERSRLEKIGHNCFSGTGIERMTIPKSVKEIQGYAFNDCKNLKAINIENGCKASLFGVNLPDSVIVGPSLEMIVGNVWVRDLRKLKNIVIPDGVEMIGNYWFWKTEIQSVTIPASVREIGANAFNGCKQLQEVALEKGSKLKVIGNYAFYNSELENFTAPQSLKVLEQGAFGWCESLKYVQLNEGLEVLGTGDYPNGRELCGVFEGSALERIILPSTLKRIEYDAFWCCKNLKSINLPEKLEFIGRYCFY